MRSNEFRQIIRFIRIELIDALQIALVDEFIICNASVMIIPTMYAGACIVLLVKLPYIKCY